MCFDCVRRASQFSLETNMCIFMCVCLSFFLYVGMIANLVMYISGIEARKTVT